MAQLSEIEQLALRRLELVGESQRLRARLSEEMDHLRPVAGWVEGGYDWFRLLRPYWPLLAAGAGFFAVRKPGRTLGTLGKLAAAWRVARSVLPLWTRFFKRDAPSGAAGE